MKKTIFAILIITFMTAIFASNMIIHKTDNTEISIPIADIESISFSNTDSSLETLIAWMTGSFSSAAQADTSSDPYHYDVRLKMVRIWEEQPIENGYWLYVEQAYAESQNSPYRQRIYRVFEQDGQLMDEIYSFSNASNYVGSWETPEDFDAISEADLTEREGCGLFFNWVGDHFYGSTTGQDCVASIPGVSYITSESEIHQNYLTSWDLGYNASNIIVMGPYSPYKFDKIEDFTISR